MAAEQTTSAGRSRAARIGTAAASLLLAAGLGAPPVRGGEPAQARGEPVRVYTNADLERLEPMPQQSGRLAALPGEGSGGEGWEFVLTMLDRERERREMEQRLRESEAAIEAMQDEPEDEDCRWSFTVPRLYPVVPGAGFIHFPRPPKRFEPPARMRTGRQIGLDRVRIPLGQRGIRTAGDHFRESVEASRRRLAEALPKAPAPVP